MKGGLKVDVGVPAFLPGSHADLRPARNLDRFIGQRGHFAVLKFNRARGNVVVSRRAVLEREREQLKEETLKVLEEGVILEGIVKNITDYGAFVDLGGLDGLLHVTDMSWGRVNKPSDVVQVGERVKVVVLKYDPERGRVSLGMKQIMPDPWSSVAERYPGRRARARQGGQPGRLRRLRRARARHRRPGARLRDVVDQARHASVEGRRARAGGRRRSCSTSTPATGASRSA